MTTPTTLTIRRPDDFHAHLRQGELLPHMVELTSRHFARALAMPNTEPPILTGAAAIDYYRLIKAAARGSDFEPVLCIKITPETTPGIAREAYNVGVRAGKLYPDNVTTNSAGGVRDFKALYPVFAEMQRCGMVLCLHGELPDTFCLDREEKFLSTLYDICHAFPDLRVVLEHVSTAMAVEFVSRMGFKNLAATITVHHLVLTLDDVVGDKLETHHFCKPIAKRPEDRDALIWAATSGLPQFFLGTDSAPHLRETKECAHGCAGVFTAPVAMALLAEVFDDAGHLDRLEAFTSVNGAMFYGLPLNEGTITLVREPWSPPAEYAGVVPLRAEKPINWKVEEAS